MIASFTEVMERADNVYRTGKHIVVQNIGIKYDDEEDNVIFSHDTFYARTRDRNQAYEALYDKRTNIDGKRLPSTMYARRYVD